MSLIKMQHQDGRLAQVEDFQKAEFEAEGFTEVKPEPSKTPDKSTDKGGDKGADKGKK